MTEVIKVEPPTPDVSRFAFPSKEGISRRCVPSSKPGS